MLKNNSLCVSIGAAFLFAFMPFTSRAQYFRGQFVNKNGNPIPEVVVINQAKQSADYTDEEGKFRVQAEIGDTIIFHRFGDMKYIVSEENPIIFDETDLYTRLMPWISKSFIEQVNGLYLTERYRDCLAYCMYYIDYSNSHKIHKESHSYVNFWSKIYKKPFYDYMGDALGVASISYIGALAAYQCSLSHSLDGTSLVNGIEWAKVSASIFEDYLRNNKPSYSSSAEDMYYYILYSEWGKIATECGDHLLRALSYDRDAKKDSRWLWKKYKNIDKLAYDNTINRESLYDNYPLISYKIIRIALSHQLSKGKFKDFKQLFTKCFDATQKLIQSSKDNYNYEVHTAVGYLSSLLTGSVINQDFCKKVGDDYERFCMEQLTKLQDISYYLNGAVNYSLSPHYTLDEIQSALGDDDLAILHFEGPVAPGGLYATWDLSTRFRNYALVLTKTTNKPALWHRGYIDNKSVNDLSVIKESYPDKKKFYFVGTPRMSFIDIAGNDSTIVRLHSLSQLLNKKTTPLDSRDQLSFIGDLNYWRVGDLSFTSSAKGNGFGRLLGPANELKTVQSLFTHVYPITGDDASRGVVMSEISRNRGIVHISTHGDFQNNYDNDLEDEALILKKNIMDNSRLILSGFNDNPNSALSYISGSDILKLKKIDTKLIFLDACLSGSGAVGAGGPVGIAEAFHLVGANNVICYLEPIDDNLATEFARFFYTELAKGSSCHDAFFRAKSLIKEDIKIELWE